MNLDNILAHAATGKAKNPRLASRIDGALRIIVKGGIQYQGDETFLVRSESDPTKHYLVNGTCQCADFHGVDPKTGERLTTCAPDTWCKHRLAMLLLVKEMTAEQRRIADHAVALQRIEAARTKLNAAIREYELAIESLSQLAAD